ncbi:MAG: TetR/AcrR family transcriptional regulator [Hyphomicrobiaceae bacterium]
MEPNVTSVVEVPELIQKRRGQIVAAATKLFSSQGFYRTTIKDIAQLAGISSGLVYQYVREKEDVLLLVLLEVVDSYAREIPKALEGVEDPLDRLATAVRAYCRVVDRHRAATVLAYRSTKSLSPNRRELIQQREVETNQFIVAAIVDCVKAGIIRNVNADVLAYQIVLIAHGWALKSWYFKDKLSLDEYTQENLDILLNGILTPVGKKRYARLEAQSGPLGGAS